MSGFQIPGLGNATPGEKLPPLPADVVAAAVSASGHEDLPDAAPTTNEPCDDGPPPLDDEMVIDEPQPQSPPSLTGALEAALGGLDSAPTAEAEHPQPAPLQPDTSEHPEWEIDSSPYESSSSSVSTTSSEDEDSDNEGYELMGVEETARMLMAEGASDDEGDRAGKGTSGAQLRTKNEVPEEVIPRPDVTITEDMPIEELGAIEHVVETTALIKAITPGEYQVLDSGSVLCTSSRVVVGAIAETIGKVLQPMYTVRFNSVAEIAELGLEVGTKLYYTPKHASFIFTEPLKNVKGSDASNLYDEEAGDDEMEFSDDEKEAEHKRAVKQKKKEKWMAKNPDKQQQPHPLRQETSAVLNYDDNDADDGPYKPLARPSSFAAGPGSETYESQPRRGGRGRGDFRGRGRGGAGRGGRGSRDGYALPPQSQQQQQQQAQPQQAAPSMPSFPFQMPGWPQPPAGSVPPPPPGWQPGQQANPAAFMAALMGQMQAQQNAQGGSWQPPPPPPPPNQ